MKKSLLILSLTVFIGLSYAQETKIKFIPQASLKIGSQQPAVGGQYDLVIGYLHEDNLLLGLGGGYCSDMGMNGSTVPLYLDGRYYFSFAEYKSFLIEVQSGININKNPLFKTGFIMAGGIGYKFDFFKINNFKFPAFYSSLTLEYSSNRFKDEYRGFVIQDGILVHTILNIKVAIDIPPVKF